MAAYAKVAAAHGQVDPLDADAVKHFYVAVLPTLSPDIQQAIVDDLFLETVGTTGRFPDEETLQDSQSSLPE
jgi:hypothetical protein